MKHLRGFCCCWCLPLMLLGYNGQAAALAEPVTLALLVDQGKLKLRTWIEPAEAIVVGQEVQLTIEVSTQRWFAGGTTIRYPDENNLVILRRDSFANNLSQRAGAITWVIQRWNLELYPQAAGAYRVPAITLELAINDADAGVVRGTLETAPIAFNVTLPPALKTVGRWVATPALTLEHEIDREPTALAPGDAFTRHITLRATHVTAMMLHPVVPSALPGLPAYEEAPRLRDISNRGEATAERRQSITYVVEQPGQYLLPEQVLHWWDTSAGDLKTVVLPELRIDAGAPAASGLDAVAGTGSIDFASALPRYWLPLVVLGLCLCGGVLVWRHRTARVSEAALVRRVRRALRAGDHEQASRLLYNWLNLFQPQPNWYQLRAALCHGDAQTTVEQVDALLASAYGPSPQQVKIELPRLRATGDGRRWWRKLRAPTVSLELNPGDNAAK